MDGVVVSILGLLPHTLFVLGVLYSLLRDGLNLSALKGRSVGKHVFNLKVVSSTDGSDRTDWATSIKRNILFIIPVITLVEMILVSVSADGRRLGDRLADTRVVEA